MDTESWISASTIIYRNLLNNFVLLQMVLTQLPRLKKWLIRFGLLILSCIIIFWAGAHLFVPGLIKKSASEFGAKIGYEIAYQDLSISPLSLRVEIDGLRLVDGRHGKLLELKKSVVMLKWSRLMIGEVGFDEILFDEPSIKFEKHVSKGRVGEWNWQELISAATRDLGSCLKIASRIASEI